MPKPIWYCWPSKRGKSTLFNRIIGKGSRSWKTSPVLPDRLYREAEWLDKPFLLVDTGGITSNKRILLTSKFITRPNWRLKKPM